ncbi:hypothetical protein CF386_12515 [Paraphotobacterium marinum]|uniref:Uncharacterized protein n=1 Tax=Paraphotobacterium marinum TaxID=1755811 RepID=A0A220VHJ5_9GAMM|nr:hypothetical protein [Paraphotobacterium marinum]ASK79854.1 hypothetical protein CF386_12515 [Paraphotobacterium marinum]
MKKIKLLFVLIVFISSTVILASVPNNSKYPGTSNNSKLQRNSDYGCGYITKLDYRNNGGLYFKGVMDNPKQSNDSFWADDQTVIDLVKIAYLTKARACFGYYNYSDYWYVQGITVE